MPESGSSGSVGEPPGNRRLYPDALYLYVHKGVTQNFLELFRGYYKPAHTMLGSPQRHLCP